VVANVQICCVDRQLPDGFDVPISTSPAGMTGLLTSLPNAALGWGVPGDECAAWLALLQRQLKNEFRIEGSRQGPGTQKHISRDRFSRLQREI
jgi:hypothetical protein